MYTAIIAEDSKPILRNIQALIQSTELPIRIAATVSNGIEALEFIKEHPVDILLTDIRMPKLDGLALIEQCKLVNPRLKAVLISGYSDFEYTRKALNLQVFDYLLKPVERHQLVDVMERLVKQLDEQQRNEKDLFEGIVEPEFLSSMELGMDFYTDDKFMLILRRQPFTPELGLDLWTENVIQRCLAEVSAPDGCWVFPTLLPEKFLALVNGSVLNTYLSVHAYMEAVSSGLQVHGIQVSIAAEPQLAGILALVTGYEQLDKMMNEQLSISVRLMDTVYSMPKGMLPSGEMEKLTGLFADMIGQRKKERFTLLLKQQLLNFQSTNIRITELERFIWFLAEVFNNMVSHQHSWDRLSLAGEVELLLARESYDAFGEAVLSWTEQSFELLHLQNKKSGQELFQQLDQYLQQNIYSKLSISDVALKFHVSPSYISRIVKKHSQSTFVHYFMQLKIDEACRLIATKPELKVKDVSEVLSFGDQHYFSKVFKEYTGCSPTEYKEGRIESGSGLPFTTDR
ncbi:response regulator transcription factor [Paenibacillus sp. FA6]|uniref:response regulator transcription factor n=1 Tax=Paenibacillus sp. FA6 TaxID=3413029 RepID=UPI003F65BDBD